MPLHLMSCNVDSVPMLHSMNLNLLLVDAYALPVISDWEGVFLSFLQ